MGGIKDFNIYLNHIFMFRNGAYNAGGEIYRNRFTGHFAYSKIISLRLRRQTS